MKKILDKVANLLTIRSLLALIIIISMCALCFTGQLDAGQMVVLGGLVTGYFFSKKEDD